MSDNFYRRDFIKYAAALGAGAALSKDVFVASSGNPTKKMPATEVPTSYKPCDPVRIGIVGVGVRGTEFVNLFLNLKGCVVKAVGDIEPYKVEHCQKLVEQAGFEKPTGYSKGETDFKRMCQNEDLDLVIAAVPVQWHVPVCVEAMKNGKHSATEVHATYDIDECWELIETAEKYKKQCGLLENYNYIRNVLMALKMARMGVLGEIIHCESGYHHDVRSVRFGSDGSLLWRAKDMLTHNGNLYPTHSVGPIGWWMNINRGDRFDYLVSMSSKSTGMNLYAKEHFGKDHPSTKNTYTQGDMSSTLIRTAKGNTIMLYFDAQMPRPYDLNYEVHGNKGIFSNILNKVHIEDKSPSHQWESVEKYRKEYEHPLWAKLGDKARNWGHWGSDYMMMYRLVEAFRKGEPFEMDVYDAAAWSVISPLSEVSVANKSKAVDIPDFTRGKWKTNNPVGILEA